MKLFPPKLFNDMIYKFTWGVIKQITYLLSGSTTPTPSNATGGYICPLGHYCLAGAFREEKCQPGTYAPVLGLGQCWPCRAGYTCTGYGTIIPSACPTGHYCENGTATSTGEPCPVGTYQPLQNRTSLSDCVPCPPGQFCNATGRDAPAGPCDAGFLCTGGATSSKPDDSKNYPCPVGHYCEIGTKNATKCPPGTLNKFAQGISRNSCLPCDPGMFCEKPGLYAPSGKCLQGYYCPDNVEIIYSEPSSFPCPRGYYCLNGTSVPKGCPPGSYQPAAGSWSCRTCPAGKFCPGNTSDPLPCPPHSYCLNGTIVPTYCPNGTFTYQNVTGLYDPTQCTPCTRGSYCQRGIIAGNCSGGYICYRGSPDPLPANGLHGIICPLGYYCPPGTTEKLKCPKGLVISQPGKSSINDCQRCPAGFICTDDNTVPQPCERGFYCPYNLTRQACRIGTYNNETHQKDEAACRTCPPRFWCRKQGMT